MSINVINEQEQDVYTQKCNKAETRDSCAIGQTKGLIFVHVTKNFTKNIPSYSKCKVLLFQWVYRSMFIKCFNLKMTSHFIAEKLW